MDDKPSLFISLWMKNELHMLVCLTWRTNKHLPLYALVYPFSITYNKNEKHILKRIYFWTKFLNLPTMMHQDTYLSDLVLNENEAFAKKNYINMDIFCLSHSPLRNGIIQESFTSQTVQVTHKKRVVLITKARSKPTKMR